ncbi:MAG TPA: T9SS type A sorting domain-containing protein, partial [candidate division Zixibacteria bacterium]|nr:T9SS type A sorting domain-containing protein [candidate division Zixibacteria bacterium]
TPVLLGNYPNPFNPATQIGFSLPAASHVTLVVYNIMGQQVAVLADGQYEAGDHSVTWDASAQSSGVYLYLLDVSGFSQTRKMMLLK